MGKLAKGPATVVASALLATLAAAGCGRSASREAPGEPDGAAADGGTRAAAADASAAEQVSYDEDGAPRPSKRLAFGTAVPAGFERVEQAARMVTYEGAVPHEKAVRFYRKYLICSQVSEHRRGVFFSLATPEPPGDGSRTVTVGVLPVGQKHSRVLVFDRTPTPGGPEPSGDPEVFEKLHEKAHRGPGSVAEPIPGTY